MLIQRFMQAGTHKEVAINMALMEAIMPRDNGKGSLLKLHPLNDGQANDWHVTDEYDALVKSLQAAK